VQRVIKFSSHLHLNGSETVDDGLPNSTWIRRTDIASRLAAARAGVALRIRGVPAGAALVSATIASWALGGHKLDKRLLLVGPVEIDKNVTENATEHRAWPYPVWLE